MSDQTHARLEVIAVGDGEEQAVLDVLNEYGLSDDGFASFPTAGMTKLELGTSYVNTQFTIGDGEDLTQRLLETAPGAFWEFIEDPVYEWLGTYHCHIPALGYYSADCDGDGQPVFNAPQVLNMTKLSELDLLKELGLPWQLEFRRLSKLLTEEES